MPLPAESRLGPYRVLSPLGAGGMGEVYRAHDERLERDVAIKVLPESMASSAEALSRFQREAKAVAALSHPNILAVYDIGESEGRWFLVSELLEGDTLRRELANGGAMPWRRVAQLGAVIAEAVAAAHGKGIVHRDLKPENIFLTSEGRVKILDFGLARVGAERKAASEQEAIPTTPLVTEPGLVMGTLGYMSPEQVRGETAEAASDIFSIGCVLYEMLTGNRPFRGSTPADVMAAILRDHPAPVGGAIPAELIAIVTRCLEKEPARRFQSAGDLAFALQSIGTTARLQAPRLPRTRWWGVAAAVAIAVFAAIGFAVNRNTHPPVYRTQHVTDAEAYRLYLQGQRYWNKRDKEGLLKAIDYFNQAIDRDPLFAKAYAALAGCYAVLDTGASLPATETFPKAKAAAQKALEIDDTIAEAHTNLAYVKHYYDRDWKGAEAEYRRALALDPKDATTHQWYAEFLTSMGRFSEAKREGAAAAELDPLSPMVAAVRVWNAGMARDPGSIDEGKNVVATFPRFGAAYAYLGRAYFIAGRYADAAAQLEQACKLFDIPLLRQWLATAYIRMGEREKGRALAAEVEKRGDYLNPYYTAYPYIAFGDENRALDELQKALDAHVEQLVWLNVDPMLDPLRSSKRFRDLLRKAGFSD